MGVGMMMFYKCWYWYYIWNFCKLYYNGGFICRVCIVGISVKWYKYDLMFEKKIGIYFCVVNYNKVYECKFRVVKMK